MIIDTHLHESKYSLDSHVSLQEIVLRAKEMGLDGICITDHESNAIREEAADVAKEHDLLIIVGAEFLTYEGDMTVFGLEQLPEKMVHAQELVDMVSKVNGIAVSSHPYRQNNRGMGDHIRELKNLWGVESFNGSTEYHHNHKAFHLANELGIPSLGGSDAHDLAQIGRFATRFPHRVRDEKDFIEAVKRKYISPVAYENGGFVSCSPQKIPDKQNLRLRKSLAF